MLQNHPKQHLLGLDGLRGVAALVVLFLHGTVMFNIGYLPPAAALAVDFFFLLSGYVIAYAYDERLARSGLTWVLFMKARIIRLYPMIFVGTLVSAVVVALSQLQKHQFDVSTSLLLTAGSLILLPVGLLFGVTAYPLDNPAWSLFFEFVANAFYGSRFGKLGNRYLAVLVVLSGAGLIAVTVSGISPTMVGWSNPPSKFLLGFLRVAYPFGAGVLLYRAAGSHRMPNIPIGLIGVTLALLLLLPIEEPAYNLLLILIAFPVLVACASRTRLSGHGAHMCSVLGQLSYPLYLMHWPIYQVIRGVTLVMHLTISPWLLLVTGASVSIVTSQALLTHFDEPVRLWLRNRSKPSQQNFKLGKEQRI